MTARAHRIRSIGALTSRIVAALVGGYALAALCSVAVLALPISKPQAVLTGQLASFAICAGVVIWAFAARSALTAWIGLALVAAVLGPLAWSAS
ncbi:DUF3649 domain-containing protein [Rhodopseudomonas sp. WA056]|uniref:DUF3649 domain-containing protein n=1 Tax=Rhodopseudomonas sp. WA056 TaxID=2269367 RepID=UPI0013DEB64F|nr:DUF3649 domain-containing protein [Rhodopseudomonas sp. WA056]NEW87521.1 DUF3649 domain-containing protein [Rhodopseudomonas sp. WA056]